MSNRRLNEIIEEGLALKNIAQSYSEVASIKLKRIRAEVEKTRLFYDELTQVYGLIKKIAVLRKVVLPTKIKKTVSILITSNYRFHGSINNQLIHYYLTNTAKTPCDKIVVGKTGQQYLKSINYFHAFDTVNFRTDLPSTEELKTLVDKTENYEQVLVFYAQFKSVLVQVPIQKDITQTQQLSVNSNEKSKVDTDYIFEPDILKMLQFFDGQIKNLLLEQTFLESELARTASRLVAMDQAQSNAKDFVKDQRRLLIQDQKSQENSKLLDMLTFRAKFNKEYQKLGT